MTPRRSPWPTVGFVGAALATLRASETLPHGVALALTGAAALAAGWCLALVWRGLR